MDTVLVNSVTNNDDGRGEQPRVVIIGAGFGGLYAAKGMRGADADVLVIDRHNYHTFVPLLYEVATAGLEAADIAQPVRAILRAPNIRFRMAEVQGIDLDSRVVQTDAGEVEYDYLIVAAGSTTNFFGLRSVEEWALELKDLPQAITLRNHVLQSFERAVLTDDRGERERLMTIVIVGGGPTGVETSGALAELKRHVLPRDYPELDMGQARVILIEAMDHLLDAFPQSLQKSAARQLDELGVDVRFNSAVAELTHDGVTLKDGEHIATSNVLWVAGVRPEPVAGFLKGETGPGGRVKVRSTLQMADHPEVYVIGDMSLVEGAGDRGYPMLAAVAVQQGKFVAKSIRRQLGGKSAPKFHYRDRGILATVGRRKAVAHVFGLNFSGTLAWFLWLTVHLVELIGLRNRARVLMTWIWNYLRYDRVNRLVTGENVKLQPAAPPPHAEAEPASMRDR